MDRPGDFFPRTWEEVCNNAQLATLPYRVEINRNGNIELSPHNRHHSRFQAAIQRLLDRLMAGGTAYPECAIQAGASVPVADVVWVSHERDAIDRDAFAATVAPEICVEVRSPGNSRREMEAKRQDYFTAGALEVWFCDLSGNMRFFGSQGELEESRLCPGFPKRVTVDGVSPQS